MLLLKSAKILGKDKVEQVELIKTELVQKEGEIRKVPVNIPQSNWVIDIDYIIMALGSKPDEFVSELGLELNKWGYLQINEKNQTSNFTIIFYRKVMILKKRLISMI